MRTVVTILAAWAVLFGSAAAQQQGPASAPPRRGERLNIVFHSMILRVNSEDFDHTSVHFSPEGLVVTSETLEDAPGLPIKGLHSKSVRVERNATSVPARIGEPTWIRSGEQAHHYSVQKRGDGDFTVALEARRRGRWGSRLMTPALLEAGANVFLSSDAARPMAESHRSHATLYLVAVDLRGESGWNAIEDERPSEQAVLSRLLRLHAGRPAEYASAIAEVLRFLPLTLVSSEVEARRILTRLGEEVTGAGLIAVEQAALLCGFEDAVPVDGRLWTAPMPAPVVADFLGYHAIAEHAGLPERIRAYANARALMANTDPAYHDRRLDAIAFGRVPILPDMTPDLLGSLERERAARAPVRLITLAATALGCLALALLTARWAANRALFH
jgi:hypothetical protein